MKRVSLFTFLFALLGSCISGRTMTTPEDNQYITFEIHHNILIVDARVNEKWAKFVVDTGAGISLLDYRQAKKYRFDYYLDTDQRLTGFGGRSRLMRTSEVDFELKGFNSTSSGFHASDLSGLNLILSESNQRVLGILGSDFLKSHGAIIDYQQSRIVLTGL